jgi:peptidoglycan-N-acetylglucosamine deacetylase
MDLFYRPPNFVRLIFPSIIWENNRDGIILSIDDGPSENTQRMLDMLDKFKIRAIFFCTGSKIEKHFQEFSAIIRAGHTICNHGYDHKRLIFSGMKKNMAEISETNALIRSMTGKEPVLFRPPYGLFNPHTQNAVREKGMKLMLWSFLSGDHTGDFAKVRRLTDSYLEKKSIIVMHDNAKSLPVLGQSLELIVKKAADKHFVFEKDFSEIEA